MTNRARLTHTVLAIALMAVASTAGAQPVSTRSADPTRSGTATTNEPGGLARLLVNPLADMVSVPFQFNWMTGVGPRHEVRKVLNIQPVVPVSLTTKWNLITRVVMPFISQPDALGASAGHGDVLVSTFLSPKDLGHGFTIGAGPVVSVPTTTDPALGSGRWSAGPTLLLMRQQGPWAVGLLANQLWSFASAGESDRPETSQMLLQPVLAYVTSSGITVTVVSETTVNWTAEDRGDRLSVPVMATVSKILRLGVLPVSVQAGGGTYLARPQGGPRWQLRTGVVVILPKVG